MAALIASGCNASQRLPQPTVAQLLADCDAYLGQQTNVAGFLGDCGGYDCHLHVDRAEMQAWNSYVAAVTVPSSGRSAVIRPEAVMGVGFTSEAWDQRAAPLQHTYVVISGRMDSESCDGMGGTDRSPGINPTDIRPWMRAEGAPAS